MAKEAMDPARCRERVAGLGGWHFHQCSRKVWKDGYCRQHHPDTVAERNRKSRELWKKKQDASPWSQLKRAMEREEVLKAELAEAKKELEYLKGCVHMSPSIAKRVIVHLRRSWNEEANALATLIQNNDAMKEWMP